MDSGQPLRGFRNDGDDFFSSLLDAELDRAIVASSRARL